MIEPLKTWLRDHLSIGPAAMFVIAGTALHVTANLILKKPISSPHGLLAPFLAGIALESYEIWHHYRGVDLTSTQSDPLIQILSRHSQDLLLMMALPLLLVTIRLASAD